MVESQDITFNLNEWDLIMKGLFLLRNNERDQDLKKKITEIRERIHNKITPEERDVYIR